MTEAAAAAAPRAPRVTAIVIFLNEERFLAEAVESIAAQTFQDFELLLVDDGSTDGSAAIARSFCAKQPSRFRYLTHGAGRPLGIAAARTLGLQHARADLIAFLDGDDVWTPEKLAEQVAIFDAEPAVQMVYGRTLIWHQWRDDAQAKDFFYELGMQPDRTIAPPQALRVMIENQAQTPTTCNAIVRRSVIDEVGGLVEAFPTMFEDQAFYAKIMARHPIYVSSRTWARYRQRSDSLTARIDLADELRTRERFLRWLSAYLRGVGLRDPGVRAALRQELWACRNRRLREQLRRLYRKLRRFLRPSVATAALGQPTASDGAAGRG